jgi:hypothetical protein
MKEQLREGRSELEKVVENSRMLWRVREISISPRDVSGWTAWPVWQNQEKANWKIARFSSGHSNASQTGLTSVRETQAIKDGIGTLKFSLFYSSLSAAIFFV